MKPATKAICVLILAAAMLLLFAPSALAADADEVYVNNVKLDANYPYWVNGDTAATKTKPAGGYNAYFDAASSTLALSNAVLHTTYFDGAYRSMVYANGDVSILLQGQNNFTYASAAYEYIIGVRGEGGLVLAGNGSADFQITLSYADAQACAVYAADTMLIYGCGITADLQAAYAAVGILSDRDIFFLDGYADIKTTARHSNGIYSLNSHLEVRGGSLSVTAVSTNESAFALTGDEVYLEGGEGVFRAYGPNVAHGLVFYDKTLRYTGGRFIFTGDRSALLYPTVIASGSAEYILTGGPAYAAEALSGSGMFLWTSAAKDGRLESTAVHTSAFRYVQFGEWPDMPDTGDNTRPRRWFGIGALCLFAAAGLMAAARRKRTA